MINTNTQEVPTESIDAVVGEKIRNLRNLRGWTLKTLSEHSKLNINTLSLIENGKSSPSIGTLQRLAAALKVPLTAFFQSDGTLRSVVFTQSKDRPETNCCHATLQNLGKDLVDTSLEPFVMTMKKGAGSGGRGLIHGGLEFVYCLSGKILYAIEEFEYPLTPGDSLVFEARLPHRWLNINDGVSQIIIVLSSPEKNEEQGKKHFIKPEEA